MKDVKKKIKIAENDTDRNPTTGQKDAGNYKKGKVNIKGLNITIENPKGSIRTGVDKDGNEWSSKMLFTYGYFNGTIGKDGDPIDVFLGSEIEEDFDVYIIDQVEESSRAFDEHKVMFGFADIEKAEKAYRSCYNKDWKGFGSITKLSLTKFKIWIKNKKMIKYPAKKMRLSDRIDYSNKKSKEEGVLIIRMFGEVIEGKTLIDLKKQAGDLTDVKTLVIEIASPGGSVVEGLEIMIWFNLLSKQGVEIITVVVANAYSIASLIMLAANIKLISTHGKVMVHNPMIPELQYVNANDLEQHMNTLRDLESMMYELYQIFTGLDADKIKELMNNETYLTPKESVEYGFADFVLNIKKKPYKMAINIKKEQNMAKSLDILNKLTKVIGMVNNSGIVNQTYSDNAGNEIEIFQTDESTYSLGDRTNMEKGEVVLSNGSKLTIDNFLITKIDKAVDPIVEPAVESAVEPAVGEIPDIKTEEDIMAEKRLKEAEARVVAEKKLVAEKRLKEAEARVVAEKKLVAEFNEGPAPKKDAVGMEDELEKVESKFKAMEEKYEDLVARVALMEKDSKKKFEDKVAEEKYKALEKKMKVAEDDAKAKFEEVDKFQDKAAEAIDLIASSTATNFKPAAKLGDVKKESGTIFQKLKKARKL